MSEFVEQVRSEIRTVHYSLKTEKAYLVHVPVETDRSFRFNSITNFDLERSPFSFLSDRIQ